MSFPPSFYRWRPHPWHGLSVGPNPPKIVQAYIELTPFDLVKYEVDKETGYLRVDRPQRTSSQPPTLYGFIPRTYCGDNVSKLSKTGDKSDGDPLDICVISERPINRSEVILTSRVIGGLQMLDRGEVDDKIIAVLVNDNFWGNITSINDLPSNMVDRMQHYFSTYKNLPSAPIQTSIEKVYGEKHAHKVVNASILDYEQAFGTG
ncbi:MAG: inorganic pyrophosphatase [Anaerolineaceae bacterium]|nr:inorganic pyrophosphatase [Anaerolineaceae bacterium]